MSDERTCSIEGCDRPFRARNLCHSHYVTERRAGRLKPLPTEHLHKMTDTDRDARVGTCSICGPGMKAVGLARSTNGYCAEAQRQRQRNSRAKRKDAFLKYHREYNFNARLKLVRQMLDDAGWACEICGCELVEKSARIDHDHACCQSPRPQACGNCYRGVLCQGCNAGLGSFRENLASLDAAKAYLVRTAQRLDGRGDQ